MKARYPLDHLGPLIGSGLLKITNSVPLEYYEITSKGGRCLGVFADVLDDMRRATTVDSFYTQNNQMLLELFDTPFIFREVFSFIYGNLAALLMHIAHCSSRLGCYPTPLGG